MQHYSLLVLQYIVSGATKQAEYSAAQTKKYNIIGGVVLLFSSYYVVLKYRLCSAAVNVK